MQRALMLGLLVSNGWAGACDLMPNLHDALTWEFQQEWGPCPAAYTTPNRQCMTLKEPPIQIRKRLSEYASWPGADRYEWHYGDLQRGQFYDHYDVSIKPLKTGSLAILREETGPIVELARNLGLLYERTYRTTDKKAICTIPKELTDVLKTCQIKQISRQGSLLTALDLSFTMGFGKVIAPEEKYLYYHSPICPVVVVEPVQTTR